MHIEVRLKTRLEMIVECFTCWHSAKEKRFEPDRAKYVEKQKQQPNESQDAHNKRIADRKAKKNEYMKDYKAAKKREAALMGGQQVLSGFAQPE